MAEPETNKTELTAEQRQKAVDWINQKWPGQKHCGVCGHANWAMGGHIVSPTNVTGGGHYFGGAIYPLIPLTCMNCGNTLFFNAIIMGVYPKKEAAKEEPTTRPQEGSDV